jgi:hypothetical protein
VLWTYCTSIQLEFVKIYAFRASVNFSNKGSTLTIGAATVNKTLYYMYSTEQYIKKALAFCFIGIVIRDCFQCVTTEVSLKRVELRQIRHTIHELRHTFESSFGICLVLKNDILQLQMFLG